MLIGTSQNIRVNGQEIDYFDSLSNLSNIIGKKIENSI